MFFGVDVTDIAYAFYLADIRGDTAIKAFVESVLTGTVLVIRVHMIILHKCTLTYLLLIYCEAVSEVWGATTDTMLSVFRFHQPLLRFVTSIHFLDIF